VRRDGHDPRSEVDDVAAFGQTVEGDESRVAKPLNDNGFTVGSRDVNIMRREHFGGLSYSLAHLVLLPDWRVHCRAECGLK
jgi:hypothetical protein